MSTAPPSAAVCLDQSSRLSARYASKYRPHFLVGAMVAGGVSIRLLVDGLQSADAHRFLLAMIGGGVAGSAALLMLSGVINSHDWPEGRRARVGSALLFAAFASTLSVLWWFADAAVSIYLAPICLSVAMIGILVLAESLDTSSSHGGGRCLVGGLVVCVVPVPIALTIPVPPIGWTMLILLWLIGLIVVKLSITPWVEASARDLGRRRQLLVLTSTGASLVTAVALLWSINTRWAPLIGTWLIVTGLSCAVPAVVAFDLGRRRRPALAGVGLLGALATVMGFRGLLGLLPHWQAVVSILAILAFLVGSFFVLKGEGVVALVVVGALLGWVLVDRVASPTSPESPRGTILVLGDSFVAGQGATKFMEHTNSRGAGANMCRRSPRSFAQLIGLEFSHAVVDYSCNGKETHEVRGGERRSDTVPSEELSGRLVPDGHHQLDDWQLPPFGISNPADVDLVLLSVGGNDAEFSTLLTACLLPSSCIDKSREFLVLANSVSHDVATTIGEIAGVFNDADERPPIVVVPYPSYVGARGCGKAIDDEEAALANVFIRRLNSAIRWGAESVERDTPASTRTVHYFDRIDWAYAGRTLCDSDPGANFINLLPPDGPILSRLIPPRWHEGTAHPTERGHECTAVALADWLVEFGHLDDVDRTGPSPTCDVSAEAAERMDAEVVAAIERVDQARGGSTWRTPFENGAVKVGSDGREVCTDGVCESEPIDRWRDNRAVAFAGDLLRPVVLIMLGGLMLALFIVLAVPRSWLRFLPAVPSQVFRHR